MDFPYKAFRMIFTDAGSMFTYPQYITRLFQAETNEQRILFAF